VKYLFAVLVFSAVCVLLFLAQRWAGNDGETACDACEQPGCAEREVDPPDSAGEFR
jgi:hypothetical protein